MSLLALRIHLQRDIEQALSSFRAAGRLMVGSHIPLQAMAVLCRQRGQHQLALDMLIRANGMVPHDLNVQHDVAVTLFACKRYVLGSIYVYAHRSQSSSIAGLSGTIRIGELHAVVATSALKAPHIAVGL